MGHDVRLHWMTAVFLKRLLPRIVAAFVGLFIASCQTSGPGYYYQAVRGHISVWNRQRPISEIINAPSTSDHLRERLKLVLELREFARTNLYLPPGKHYLRYANLGRPSVVWNVSAAPRFSLSAKSWWYPVAGAATYRGYFDKELAERYAQRQRRLGLDAHVGGVSAYSTLGWFHDPVLNTFLFDSESDLAELLFHELAHQRVFLPGDTEFNEAFATTVAQEGTRRWLLLRRNSDALHAYDRQLDAERAFVSLVSKTRQALENLYTNLPPRMDGQPKASKAAVERSKQEILEALRSAFEQASSGNPNLATYSGWFQQPLNNAVMNTVHTYHHLVPAFRQKLESVEMNLERFYDDVKTIQRLPIKERRSWLERRRQEG